MRRVEDWQWWPHGRRGPRDRDMTASDASTPPPPADRPAWRPASYSLPVTAYPPRPPYPTYPTPAAPTSTNGFAIASMVLGILWLWWGGSMLALVFGYVARYQIRRSGGRE